MQSPLLAAVLFTAALFVPQTPTQQQAQPVVGESAPRLRLNDHDGNIVTVGGEGERWTVLAFYPKAMTPG
ncbi:MAG: hypothetical protein ACI8Y8_003661 [Planctomycetota bacterium]|jgi:hypothetical protein